ncbi:MAG: Inner membrane transport permease YbhR [bacterium ADurb.Bin212]|nr:MAG: Inner membrane transport permease YbhR [bacterium ADurb.Bin212]
MLKLFIANLKMTTRNRQALFWSFMFPLMFTFIFGMFFGKNSMVGTIGIVNNSGSEIAANYEKILKEANIFKIVEFNEIDEAKKEISKNSLSAFVYIPDSFGTMLTQADNTLVVYYDQGNAQIGSVLENFSDKFLSQSNMAISKAQEVFKLRTEKTSSKDLTYFDFVLAGILGLALMNSSIHGIAVGMSKYREDKILKRITTTPIKSWQFVGAEVLSRLVLNFLQIALILVIGVYAFDAHIYGNIAIIFAVSLVGALLFQLIGFVIASFSKTTSAAEGMATAITIPMMFLAGVFFPIDSLPSWLYSVVQYLPLAPLLRIIRGVTLEGTSPFSDLNYVLIVFAWIAASLAISIYRFRLSEE